VLLAAFSCLQVLVLRFIDPPVSTVMLWRYGEALGEADWSYRLHYQWRDLDQMARNLPNLAGGGRGLALPRPQWLRPAGHRKGPRPQRQGRTPAGASTISQQVARTCSCGRAQLDPQGLEVWYTVLIEALWPKERILEMYANIAEFGDGVYGAQAAAQKVLGQGRGPVEPGRARGWRRCCRHRGATTRQSRGRTCSGAPHGSSARRGSWGGAYLSGG
jgi:monofunctional biosynthetic peptidoglycan transglycosylase